MIPDTADEMVAAVVSLHEAMNAWPKELASGTRGGDAVVPRVAEGGGGRWWKHLLDLDGLAETG